MDDIYMNYGVVEESFKELLEHADVISTDVRKMKSLLEDLNDYWKASAATRFTFNTDDFLDLLNRFSGYYESLAEKLNNSQKSYEEFDNYFMSRSI